MGSRKGRAQLPGLTSGPVPLVAIRDQARRQLLDLIDSKRGRKLLVLDQSISGPISLLDANILELFTEHGISKLMYLEPVGAKPLDEGGAAGEARSTLFLIRPSVENVQLVAGHVKKAVQQGASTAGSKGARGSSSAAPGAQQQQHHDFTIVFVPRRTTACTRVLEEEGVLGDVSLAELPMEVVALEDDVLSLELEGAFRDCVVEGDSGALFYVARAITQLQLVFGLIPRLQGKGPAAVAVRDMCIRMRRESPVLSSTGACGAISRAILIDREADIVTPMMTQVTFEGLIDEVTGIKNGAVPYVAKDKRGEEALTSSSAASSSSRGGSTPLNSTDPFYKEFRDLPYNVASWRLAQYAREAQREYAGLSSKDISELKTFVKSLPNVMLLDRLSDIASAVTDKVKAGSFQLSDRMKLEQDIVETYDIEAAVTTIEELMFRGADVLDVLRLLVLLNECQQGLSRKHLDTLRGELLHTYGHQHLLTLNALEKAGFIRAASTSSRSSFKELRKALKLIGQEQEEAPGEHNPTDLSFLYKGYAPLSLRLVEAALKQTGWGQVAEVLPLLPGPHFDITQTLDAHGLPIERHTKQHLIAQQQGASEPPSTSPSAGGSVAPAPSAGTAAAAAAGSTPGSSTGGAAGQAGTSGLAAPQQQVLLPGGQQRQQGAGPEVVLVVFIGGVTFSEISGLRYLSSRPDSQHRFLVLTTKIVNGRTLLQSFVDPVTTQAASCIGLQAPS